MTNKFKICFYLLVIAVMAGIFVVAVNTIDVPSYAIRPAEREEKVVLPEKPKEPVRTVLAFGGDVMLSRVVGQKMVKYHDFSWPFRAVADIFASADLAVINLESPFTVSGDHFVQTGSFAFDADPRSAAGLKLAGVDLVSLANNHFGNMGSRGMRDTFAVLGDNGIEYVGAGENSVEAHGGRIIIKNGIKFGFLGYAYPETLYVAGENLAGLANMAIEPAKRDVAELKKRTDIVVVLMHAGYEYTNQPNVQQQNFARAVIDAGADLVVGHHPHWVQVTEIYKGQPILYSLGNLVFDQMWSRETQQGAAAKVYFQGRTLEKIEIIPIKISDYGQPAAADGKESGEILNRMGLKDGEVLIRN